MINFINKFLLKLSHAEIVGWLLTIGLNLIVIDYYVSRIISLTFLAGLQIVITCLCFGVPWFIERDRKLHNEFVKKIKSGEYI